MRLIFSCLLSLGAHLLLLFAPAWLFHQPAQPPRPHLALQATLQPKATQARKVSAAPLGPPMPTLDTPASAEATLPPAKPVQRPLPRPRPLRPQKLQGAALQHAQAALAKHLFYPPEAIAQGLEGDVVLLLTLDNDGQIQSVEIAKSAGHPLLDDAAMEAARHIGALPGNPHQTLLPVSFRLQ
jgi:protein TonB